MSKKSSTFAPAFERYEARQTHIVHWCNGSTSDSGSASLGSSPGWTTRKELNCLNIKQLSFFLSISASDLSVNLPSFTPVVKISS